MKELRRRPKNYSVECPTCKAAPWQPCLSAGKLRKRVHRERSALAADVAADLPHPKNFVCPTCAAEPGEKCWAMTKKAANEKGWVSSPFNRRKKFYCKMRWVVANGAEIDAAASCVDTGIWAEDFQENAAANGLLAELS